MSDPLTLQGDMTRDVRAAIHHAHTIHAREHGRRDSNHVLLVSQFILLVVLETMEHADVIPVEHLSKFWALRTSINDILEIGGLKLAVVAKGTKTHG